jgi:Uma2 family endonuclease
MRSIKYLPNYTANDYNSWLGDWELIDGIPWVLNPSLRTLNSSPIRRHQRLAMMLVFQIETFLRKEKDKCGSCEVVHGLDWMIDNSTVVRPDVAITCNDKNDFITSPPVLIIEILSPSTAPKDRHVKFGIYEEQAVKYYILVNPDTKTYSVYILTDKRYIEQKEVSSFTIHDKCAVDLDIDKALAELEME